MVLSFYLSLCAFFSLGHARAIEINGGTFNTTALTSTNVPNWTTGWGTAAVTGWNHVGTVNGASGVYVGNDWVITAGHEGAGTFSLGGTNYTEVPGSAQGIPANGYSVELTLFQITTAPNLPA